MLTFITMLAGIAFIVWLTLYMRSQKSDTDVQRLIRRGAYLQAMQEADAAIATRPRDTAMLLHRAEAAKLLGSFDEAIRTYRAILSIDSTDAAAREGLALALTHTGRELAEARQLMEETIASCPGIQEFQALSLAFIALKQGARDDALRIFRDNLELLETRFEVDYTDADPLLGETLWAFATLLNEAGEEETARSTARKVKEFAPGSVFARWADAKFVFPLPGERGQG